MARLKTWLVCVALLFGGHMLDAAPTVAAPKLAFAEYAPQPKYPAWALLRRAQGKGMFVVRVQIRTGRVKEVYVARSTGHKDLDAVTLAALKQWRFKRDALPPIAKLFPHAKDPFASEDSLAKVPVTFEIRE